MDVPASTESVSSQSSVDTSSPVSTPQDSSNTAPSVTNSPSESATTTAVVTPAVGPDGKPVVAASAPYQPNYKYKSYSKEFEFDDWAKAAIKDKETEEKARALFAKAAGLDGVKESLEKYKSEYTPQVEEFRQVKQGLEQISHFVKQKDFDNFFASLNIPLQNVYEWLERKVEEAKQPPHIQQEIAQKRELSRNMLQQQYHNQMMQEQQQMMIRQNQERELDMYSQLPQVASVQSQYEARMGDGAFKKLVLDRISLGAQQGQNLGVAEAVQMVSSTLEKFMGGTQMPGVTPQTSNQPQQAMPSQQPGKPPVLPNISSGKGTSPIKAAPKSLDEIRKLAKEKSASEMQLQE